MTKLRRRDLLVVGAAASGLLPLPRSAHATLVRGLPLPELVGRSQHIVLVTALDRESSYAWVGGRRVIVTDTRVRVEEHVAKTEPRDSEVLIRVMGGRVGRIAEMVHGQAELTLGAPCLAFLVQGDAGECWTTGMAQGHYPIERLGSPTALLSASPRLPTIQAFAESAVRKLAGQKWRDANQLVLQAARR
jgi:hypothetical protein